VERNLALLPQETFSKSSEAAPTSPVQGMAMGNTPGGTVREDRSPVEDVADGPTSHLQRCSWRHLLSTPLGTRRRQHSQIQPQQADACVAKAPN